jgi:Holliday junction resolvase RusA-like endonuclease
VAYEELFTEEFLSELQSDSPNYEKIRAHILSIYNAATGNNLEPDISADDVRLREVARWVNKASDEPGYSALWKEKSVTLPSYSSSLSAKVNTFAQYRCPICTHNTDPHIISIRLGGVTRQTRDSDIIEAFKKAIAYSLRTHIGYDRLAPIPPFDGLLCVQVVFVDAREKKGRKRKDLDNMAKLLLDSLQGNLFKNDRQIDHLSLLRITSRDDEECILVSIQPSFLNQHDDVLFQGMHFNWLGAPELKLVDFM